MRTLYIVMHLVALIGAFFAMFANQPAAAAVFIGLSIIYKMDAAA